MKIVMLCDFYNDSLQYQENLLSKYYIKNGHQVTIIASTFDDPFDYISDKYDKNLKARQYYYNGIRIIKQPYTLNILNKLRRLKNVLGILKQEKPDLIFVHDIHLNISDAIQYKKVNPGCRIIMDYHADYSNSAKNWISLNILHKVIRKYILNKARKYIDKIFYVVPSSKIFLHKVYGIPENEMELLILGADIDRVKEIKLSDERNLIRNKYNIQAGELVIFTGGKLNKGKKTDLLIEVFQKLQNPILHMFIVGDAGSEDAAFKNLLLKLSDNNVRIHFTGWLSGYDVYRYMSASDLAIFPSSQSVLWQQSISMELPLIVGDTGSQSISYLNKYGNIIILDKDEITSETIERNIIRLINNRTFLENMKLGAIKTTEEFLNYDKIILKTIYPIELDI